MNKKPELLAPAGNLEKLKIAFLYGADAVFVGGTVFGLRKYADNFTLEELKRGVDIANKLGKQVYLVLNGFAHNQDMEALKSHLDILQTIGPHAFIISDMGVLKLAKDHTTIPIHVSTQASVTNAYACQLWKNMGAKRVILAREVSIEECKKIKKQVDIELEVFIHGAMCASYSGKCVISNYTSGRDSNRGGCVQSCRHLFEISDPQKQKVTYKTHIMNAKDLNAFDLIPSLIESGIESLKIEGRMKSNAYVANAVSHYRRALDHAISPSNHLSAISNREFSTGGLVQRPGKESINYPMGAYYKEVDFIGTVKQVSPENGILVEVKTGFKPQDILLRIVPSHPNPIPFEGKPISLERKPLEKIKPNSMVIFPFIEGVQPYDLLVKPT